MKFLTILSLFFISLNCFGQVVLDADGPGNTYTLITSIFAPGHNLIEVPDCSHAAFGDHIDEVFDNELNTNVFRFYIHVTPDDDRCINSDRQHNEMKTYDIEIKQVSDGSVLFAYSNNNIVNWRPDADFVKPKWGIYRSLINVQDLRNETVLCANFSVEEVNTLSQDSYGLNRGFIIFPNPVENTLNLRNAPQRADLIKKI